MNAKLFRWICCCLLSLLPAGALAVQKHALVIGIGHYQDPAWEKINGDRDVPLMVELLRTFGYHDIVTLVNAEATKANLVSAFDALLERCERNDIVYVHFSGHGQRMTDVDGDETDDRWDEAWIPYDACQVYGPQDQGEKHLSDDEIGAWLSRLRAVVGKQGIIVVAVDACHSGDSSRAAEETPVRGVLQDFVIPGSGKTRTPKRPEEWLTLSACKPFQQNCEVRTDQGYYGMLSYALYSGLRTFEGMDNAGVLQALTRFVHTHRGTLPQSPVLSGDKEKYQLVRAFYE